MKKFLALMLCAIMTVCAVVPAFAANELTPSEPTDPFIEANVITVNFIDHVDDQPDLFDNRPYWAENNRPDYDKAGFYTSADGYITFWGGKEIEESRELWKEKTFQVKFDAPEAGYYSFAVDICSGGADAGAFVPVRIDDGETYKLMINGKWTATADGKPAPVSYYGMDEIYLEAGEHVFHIGKIDGTQTTQYYFGFKYTYVTDSGATPDAPDTEDTTDDEPIAPPPAEDDTVFADEVLTASEPTDPFIEADIVKLNFKDFVDVQTALFDNTGRTNSEGNFAPDYSKPGFSMDENAYITFWGANGFEGAEDIWGDATFCVPFTAEEAGYYSFAVDICSGGGEGAFVPVRVDDGETYKLMINGKWTANENGRPAPVTYYGMDEIYLEAGEHVFHIAKIQGTNKTQYYFGIQYTYYTEDGGDTPDTGDTTDSTDTTAPTDDPVTPPTTDEPYEVVYADETLTASEPTDPFIEADIVKLNFKDFADVQTALFDNTGRTNSEGNFAPDYSKPGFSVGEDAYVTFWGANGFEGAEDIWGNATFCVPFTAEEAGYYSFAVDICSGGGAGGFVPVRVDDGETYKLMITGKWTANENGRPAPVTYYGMDEIYLEAGEHVFHIAKLRDANETQYYFGIQYTYYTDAPETDAPETDAPETDAPETDAPETDAPETDAPETDAPETDAPETDAPTTDDPADEKGAPVLVWVILGVAAVLVVVAAVILARKKK